MNFGVNLVKKMLHRFSRHKSAEYQGSLADNFNNKFSVVHMTNSVSGIFDLSKSLAILGKFPGVLDISEGMALLFLSAYCSGTEPVVEVGSFLGKSTSFIALGAKISSSGGLFAVDMFPCEDDWQKGADGYYHIKGSNYYLEEKVFSERFKLGIFKDQLSIFMNNIEKAGLKELVTPFKGNSVGFVKQVPEHFLCRMLFIDGDHTYEGVKADIINLAPYLKIGGIICFHDYCDSFPGVVKAVNEIVVSNSYESCCLIKSLFIVKKIKNGKYKNG